MKRLLLAYIAGLVEKETKTGTVSSDSQILMYSDSVLVGMMVVTDRNNLSVKIFHARLAFDFEHQLSSFMVKYDETPLNEFRQEMINSLM